MLIFCCSMPRSGGTLLYQLTKEIAESSGLCTGRGFAKPRYNSGVVKTEFYEPWMMERMKAGAIAFGTYRDFRDVILSLRNFYNRREVIKGVNKTWTIDDVLSHRPVIISSFRGWENICSVWFRYEQPNLPSTIVDGVSERLGVSLTPGQKDEIIAKYSIENNLDRIAKQKIPMDAGAGSMLTRWHISPTRGQSIWRNELTPKEVKAIERVGGKWLVDYGYK